MFDRNAIPVSMAQLETTMIYPQAGWVEQDPAEIARNTWAVIKDAMDKAQATTADIAAVGITNQRETTIVWNVVTGEPIYNAIVWQDVRTQEVMEDVSVQSADAITPKTGLPVTPYFSASKMRWILHNVPGAKESAAKGELLFGTPDSWILWNLTGGTNDGVHLTDVTNASRTLLMNIHTLTWDDELLDIFEIPRNVLPEIRSSSEIFATAVGELEGVPVAGILGDQHAALFGQQAINPGDAKCTYGTGGFLLINTGTAPVTSSNGLLTTIAYKIGDQPVTYALEGSIAVAGSLLQWLRDNLGLISDAAEADELAQTVADNGGAYIVPAFSGLFAPYWKTDARGVIVGLTRYVTKAHLCRAALEAVAFQTADVVSAATADSHSKISELKVDGGMVASETLMQFQADILGVDIVGGKVAETTALGAAFAAGLATGFWKDAKELTTLWQEAKRWQPAMKPVDAERYLDEWHKAVTRSFDWAND